MAGTTQRRVHEVDLLRGLAIVGMMIAHLGPDFEPFQIGEPATWWAASDGHPSAVFAFLAGVSLELMTRSAVAAGGPAVVQARVRLMTRAAILMGIGLFVINLQTLIVGILFTYGLLFLVLAFCFRWRTRTVAVVLVVLVLAGPLVVAALVTGVLPIQLDDPGFDLLAGSYPLFAWLAYAFGGLLAARLLLRSRPLWKEVLAVGLALMLAGWVLIPEPYESVDDYSVATAYASLEPHSGGLLEILGNLGLGAALLVLFGLLLRVRPAVIATYPMRAIGMMSLTVYVAHVLTAAWFRDGFVSPSESDILGWDDTSYPAADVLGFATVGPGDDLSDWPVSPWYLIGSIAVAMVIASVWMRFFRRGPLEHLVYQAATIAADLTTPPAPTPAAPTTPPASTTPPAQPTEPSSTAGDSPT